MTLQELTMKRDRLRDELRRLIQEEEETRLALYEVISAIQSMEPAEKE